MTDLQPHASTRASALSLLADGNSPESVSHVLGVGVDELLAWQRGAPAPAPPPRAPAAHGRPLAFETEAAYRYSRWNRVPSSGLTPTPWSR